MSCSETCPAQSGTSQGPLWARSLLQEGLWSQRVWQQAPLCFLAPQEAWKEHLLGA